MISGAVETASEVGLEYRVVPFDDWSSMEPTGALMIVGTFAEDESAVTRIRGGH